MSSKPTSDEIRRRILAGQQKRQDAARKQRETEREEQEEALEQSVLADRGDISQFVGNILVSLLFVSMPLTEPKIDWVQVLIFVAANVIWNVFFHRHTWVHYATFIMINVLLVQWTHEIYNIPQYVSAVPPLHMAVFLGGNATALFLQYWFYIRHAEKKREREEKIDTALLVTLLLNVVALVATGTIPLSLLYQAFKSLVNLIT